MRSIVLIVIFLLAIFTILRVYSEEDRETRYVIHPGLIELKGEDSGATIAFGLLERSESSPGGQKSWNIFPIRISVHSGKKQFYLGLNGFSFITRSGVHIGKPIKITGVRRSDVISIGGEVTVEGTVEGDVWTLGADILLKPKATVTGNVVALGGTIEADRGSHIKGNKEALPSIKIPFIGLLASDHSAETFYFIIEILGIFLYLIILLLVILYGERYLTGINRSLSSQWKGSLLYLAVAVLLLPIIVILLITSLVGIILIPIVFIILILLAYLGFTTVTVRLGTWLRRKDEGSGTFLYTSGLLGLLIIKGPVLLGILISLLASDLLKGIGHFLVAIGSLIMALAYLYGLGGALQYLRTRTREAA